MHRAKILALMLCVTATACTGNEPFDATEVAMAVEATLAAYSTTEAIPSPGATRPEAAATPPLVPAPTLTSLPADTSLPTEIPTPTDTPQPSPSPIPSVKPTLLSTATPTSMPFEPKAMVQSESLNLRDGPGTAYPVRASATRGEELMVTGRNEDGSWLQVKLVSGVSAWAARWLVQVSGDVTALPIPAEMPTPPPAQATAPAQASGARDLLVSFLNMHYECQQRPWAWEGPEVPLWGYRSFQVDMYIKNLGSAPVEPPWEPTRWIITDGEHDYVSDLMWQWVNRRTGFYEQPTVNPGESAGWTFLAFPIDRNQWVKAVEFDWDGQLYRQEFDLGSFGNADNYTDCGDPRWHEWRATPTPRNGPRNRVPTATTSVPGSDRQQPTRVVEPTRQS
jgi:hypothetical protein